MKEWANTLILCTVASAAIKSILPGGEKSPLYSSLKFLLSLILLTVVFAPVFSLFGGNTLSKEERFSLPTVTADSVAVKEDLLQRSISGINEETKDAFPEEVFSLSFTANEEKIPTGILVECEDETAGREICSFLTENFSILATLKPKE